MIRCIVNDNRIRYTPMLVGHSQLFMLIWGEEYWNITVVAQECVLLQLAYYGCACVPLLSTHDHAID